MMSGLVLLSIVAYLPFYFWDRSHLEDEREKWIELKTSAFQSQATLLALAGLAVLYVLQPDIPVWVCLLTINIVNLYSEVLGKIYFRRRL